eukprot:UN18222
MGGTSRRPVCDFTANSAACNMFAGGQTAILKRLLLQPWLRARYAVSDKAGTTLRGSQFEYGVIMCTALTIEQMDLYD